MIEYLHNAIRATAGEDIVIIANIAEDGVDIQSGCGIVIHTNDEEELAFPGEYIDDFWYFTIPAEATVGLNGRYWYHLYKDDDSICFKEPLYLI